MLPVASKTWGIGDSRGINRVDPDEIHLSLMEIDSHGLKGDGKGGREEGGSGRGNYPLINRIKDTSKKGRIVYEASTRA